MTKETSKCYQMRLNKGYFDKYLTTAISLTYSMLKIKQ